MHNPRDDQAARPKVIAAGPSDAARVIDMLMLAFAADPPNRWLFPDAHDYVRNFPKFVQGLGGSAFANGTAFMTSDCSGAILWLAPNVGPDEEAPHASSRRTSRGQAGGPRRRDGRMGGYHPQEPHWYLPFIGVDPSRQGAGIGAALLRPMLEKCDADGLPAYVESSNPKNRRSISARLRDHGRGQSAELSRRSHRCSASRTGLQPRCAELRQPSSHIVEKLVHFERAGRDLLLDRILHDHWSGFSSASPKGWKSIPSGEGGIAAFVSFSMR